MEARKALERRKAMEGEDVQTIFPPLEVRKRQSLLESQSVQDRQLRQINEVATTL